jgi:hypothetical protein
VRRAARDRAEEAIVGGEVQLEDDLVVDAEIAKTREEVLRAAMRMSWTTKIGAREKLAIVRTSSTSSAGER